MSRPNNKIIFDINSKDTFNQLDWNWAFPSFEQRQINLEDYWVTKHFYSINPSIKPNTWWRSIVSQVKDLDIYSPVLKLKLNCDHIAFINQIKFRNITNTQLRKTRISCQACGGTGEIKFNE